MDRSPANLGAVAIAGHPGPALSGVLWQHYVGWLEAGVPSGRILALLDSATRTAWTALLKGEPPEHLDPWQRPAPPPDPHRMPPRSAEQRVHTPNAWIRSELARWWPLVDAELAARGLAARRPVAHPLIVAVDLAQHLMDRFSSVLRPPEGPLLEEALTPRPLQNIQLLDALARGIEQGASLAAAPAGVSPCRHLAETLTRTLIERGEAGDRPKRLLEEAATILECYLAGLLENRILDYSLALDCYAAFLWPHPRYQEHLLARTSHVLIESLDEASPRLLACYEAMAARGLAVVATLQSEVPEASVAYPFAGGLREHLGSDPQRARTLAERMELRWHPSEPRFLAWGRALHDALHGEIRPLGPTPGLTLRLDHLGYGDMLAAIEPQLAALLATVPPAEIALVVPTLDPLVLYALRQRVEGLGHALYVFAGSNRLTDYRPVRLMLTLVKLAYPAWGQAPSAFELVELVETVTGLNPMRLGAIAERLLEGDRLGSPEQLLLLEPELSEAGRARYADLHDWLRGLERRPHAELDLFLRHAFARIYAPPLLERSPRAQLDQRAQREVSQLGQLIDLAASFQAVDRRCADPEDAAWGRRFMAHLATQPIAERPFFKREPRRDALMLSTAHQLAERGYRSPGERLRHLFVLDVGSERWWKPDRKELCNPRVLSPGWPERRYTHADERAFMDRKLARVLYACCLKPTEGLHFHGCLTDAEGRENLGELPALLEAIAGRLPTAAGMRA